MLAATLLAAAASIPNGLSGKAAGASCCAYGGAGSMVGIATGSISIPGAGFGDLAVLAPILIGANPAADTPFISVLIAPHSGPEDAFAGWNIVQSSVTQQTLTWWYNNTDTTEPVCGTSTAPAGEFVTSFEVCGGGELFPNLAYAYGVGPIPVYGWNQVGNRSTAFFADASVGCQPVSLQGPSTPLNGGAYVFNFINGTSAAAPTSWALAPSRCKF